VAIIAILAAIAVPNFLEAQTRAKVSRMKADMRTVAVGIEAYNVDFNHAPFDWADDVAVPYYLNRCITTPIAYLTNAARMQDIFSVGVQATDNNQFRERLRYRAFRERYLSGGTASSPFQALPGPGAPGMLMAQQVHGSWLLVSKGPDGTLIPLPTGFADGNNQQDWLWQQYDPTNGTKSRGEVMRSQAQPDVAARAYPINVTY